MKLPLATGVTIQWMLRFVLVTAGRRQHAGPSIGEIDGIRSVERTRVHRSLAGIQNQVDYSLHFLNLCEDILVSCKNVLGI